MKKPLTRLHTSQSERILPSVKSYQSLISCSSKASLQSARVIFPNNPQNTSEKVIIRNFTKKKAENINFPKITSDSFCVISVKNHFEMISGQRQSIKRKIASMTKIMTLHCSLKLCRKFNLIPNDILVRVKKDASSVIGTIAKLNENDYILLQDLFYALMLPSGNDAAVCLADFFGKRLKLIETRKNLLKTTDRVQIFINYMNKEAIEMGMTDTL